MNIPLTRWQFDYKYLLLVSFSLVLLVFTFWEGLEQLIGRWEKEEEYSHSYMIPLIVMYFIWQKRDVLKRQQFIPSWTGGILVVAGLIFFLVGEISALFVVVQFAFIAVLIGLLWAIMGWQALKIIIIPLLLLIFAIPLPYFLEATLSTDLQLISSELGVTFIRWYRVPVFLEGNLIDLGIYKLQVVEACSGLRYLYPLMSLGFICAYMFNTVFWKRACIFISTIPITITMNSFRIGMIGVLVHHFGISAADGFLHDFEGWIIFMACIGVLILEMLLLTMISSDRRPLSEVFGLVVEEPSYSETDVLNNRPVSYPFMVSIALLLVTLMGVISIDQRAEFVHERKAFPSFPMQFSDWTGTHKSMENEVVKFLGVSDYILADYTDASDKPVNFYVAYYQSQRKGVSPHSPRVCIPGGGWEIAEIKRSNWEGLPVNRIVIKKKAMTQLVYYWFQQRGRQMSNEYLMKWYLFKDALVLNRTDGALVRLTSAVYPGESINAAEARIQKLAAELLPVLPEYIPE